MRLLFGLVICVGLLAWACGDGAVTTTSTRTVSSTITASSAIEPAAEEPFAGEQPTVTAEAWVEEELTFLSDGAELHGILTLPAREGPHPAVVMPFESVGTSGGLPPGVDSRYQTELARRLAGAGFAAFRYDPPGIGRSQGEAAFPSMQERGDEAIAALRRVQDHPAIQGDRVGMWGISQEAWVLSIAAVDHPDDVAFIIAVSGSGISVAEQQIWGIEAQSRAAGLAPGDIERATLFGRLLIDWQLTNPLYRDANRQAAESLGDGPWQDFLALVYGPDMHSPADDLRRAIEILTSVQDEPWAEALHLKNVTIPALQRIPSDQIEAVKAAAEQSLLFDPGDSLRRVQSAVLAFFGEDDIVQPTDRSAALYAQYLEEAQNDHVTIVILPGVGHDIVLTTPGYWEQLITWLDSL
jgi:pimeloyl-ACP methyl ester carboxylesterase